MPSRLTLAAGVLGVASLAFVGIGGYAAFTNKVSLDTPATSGTFVLSTTGYYTAPLTSGTPQDTVTGVNTPTITPDGSSATITWTTPNMNPGSAYHAQFLVGDIGSLPGEMSQVTYAPPSSLSSSQSSLLSSMTVTVSEMVPGSGHWTQLPGGGSASGRHTFTTAPAISGLKPRGTQIGFMVTYTLSKSATNTSENATVTPTLNFVGTTMPS